MNGLTDFADWLSPMLVKELRQGVRTRVFVISFLLLQGSLMFLAVTGLLAADAQEDTSSVTNFFWVLVGVFLILILPASGLNAVSNERTANTLDLIFLTRLSARRIVAGKWLAIVTQIALLIFTILPFIVLRYFLGGVNLWSELLGVGGLLLSSAVLSAIAVGISSLPTGAGRACLVAGVVIGIYVLGSGVAMVSMGRFGVVGGGRAMVWKSAVATIAAGVFVILYMLEMGAARIAPPAENHSSPLRLLGFGAIAGGITLDRVFFHSGSGWTLAAFCFMLPVLIGGLCESPRMIANIYRPFVRRGFLGKAAGRFFYPGWPSATPYALVTLLALGLGLYYEGPVKHRMEAILLVVTIAGTLLLPAAIIRFFGKRLRYPWAMYAGVQVVFVLLHAFAEMLKEIKGRDIHPVLEVIPTCALLNYDFSRVHSHPFLQLTVVGTVTACGVIALLFLSWRPWGEIQAFEKKVALTKDDGKVPAPAEAAASPAAR